MNETFGTDEIESIADIEKMSGRGSAAWKWLFVFGLALAVLGFGWWFVTDNANDATQYVTAPIKRGELVVTVSATGTLEPTNEVDISSELSGTIRKVLVDYNDKVRTGQALAELDTDKLEAEVAHARATLASAEARVREAKASLTEAKQDFDRYQRLLGTGAASEQKFSEAKATHERAKASVDSANADVAVAEADLTLKETDLEKACICCASGAGFHLATKTTFPFSI